jgi:hypothetical protein
MPMYLHSHALFLVPQYFHRELHRSIPPPCSGVRMVVLGKYEIMGWIRVQKIYNIE